MIRSVDANIVLRFLTGTPPDQHLRASRLFAAVASAKEQVHLDDVVVAEIVHVLDRQYHRARSDVASALTELLSHEGVLASDKESLRSALGLFERVRLDFVDALLAAKALRRGESEIWSFDRDFDRIPGIRRLEP